MKEKPYFSNGWCRHQQYIEKIFCTVIAQPIIEEAISAYFYLLQIIKII